MGRIYLNEIFERIFQLKGIKSEKEIDALLARMKYDKKFRNDIDKLLKMVSIQLEKGIKLKDVKLVE